MTAEFDEDTLATYTCNDGFRLFGFDTRLCLRGGTWSGVFPPVCIGT